MIGKPQWFRRRRYGGWGLRPATWQGWVYIAVFVAPFVAMNFFPTFPNTLRTYLTVVWVVLLLLDITHIMFSLKDDEREKKIEALAERNASWAMVGALLVGVLYQVVQSGLTHTYTVDWFLVAPLIVGAVVKGISNVVYERKAM